MGTEKLQGNPLNIANISIFVKLNNPQMGTEKWTSAVVIICYTLMS